MPPRISIERLLVRVHETLSVRPRAALAAVGVAAAIGASGLIHLRLDMSFRPLFADAPEEERATAEFEAEFGQPSGAFVGAVITVSDPLDPSFLAALDSLSSAVAAIPHVVEVASLTRIAVPDWSAGRARGAWIVSPGKSAAGGAASAEAAAAVRSFADDPAIRGALLSRDGGSTLLLARLDLPLADLEGRRPAITRLEDVVTGAMGDRATLHFVGVSVVESGYARVVLASLARSFLLTMIAIVLVLRVVLGSARAVLVVMAGVSLATPAALGVMALMGRPITIIGSMVPVMILIIGVADAVHMHEAWRRLGGHARAVRRMVAETALPCMLTATTTVLGFVALGAADIRAIRAFGFDVAVGVALVWAFNMLLVPLLLGLLPMVPTAPPTRAGRVRRGTTALSGFAVRRPIVVTCAFMLLTALGGLALPQLRVSQKFNEEVSPTHPLRVGQAVVEREFGGFLGPELELRWRDGQSVLAGDGIERLGKLRDAVAALPGVLVVASVLDVVPAGAEPQTLAAGLAELRRDSLLGRRVRELVNEDATAAALLVRTEDLGSGGADALAVAVRSLAEQHLPEARSRVVGQWWLAQLGMGRIIHDTAASFLTSCIFVLGFVALVLRSRRLFLIALLPNLLPMFAALAFMASAGIPLRIGTALILAIALGIAVDDTVHLMVRLRAEEPAAPAGEAVLRAIADVGPAMVCTTVVLMLGFLSMLWNDLIALRDMGLVGAFTLGVALLAELLLAPALFVLSAPRSAPAYVGAPAALRHRRATGGSSSGAD